jgi:hypothetical protein
MIAGIVTGGIALLWILFCAVIGLLGFAFWLWMLIHAIGNKALSDGEKIAWVLAVIFLPFLGSILYFFIGKPKGD